MLVIAPMPVNVIHDEFVMGDSCRARVLVPALPMLRENCEIVSIDKPAETEQELELPQYSKKSTNKVFLPERKSNANLGLHVKGDFQAKKIDAALAFRPAVPVAGAMRSDALNYEKNVVKRTYLIALFLFLVVVFLGGMIYAVQYFVYSYPTNEKDHAGLRYVQIALPSYSHVREPFGEQVKADQLYSHASSFGKGGHASSLSRQTGVSPVFFISLDSFCEKVHFFEPKSQNVMRGSINAKHAI